MIDDFVLMYKVYIKKVILKFKMAAEIAIFMLYTVIYSTVYQILMAYYIKITRDAIQIQNGCQQI